ncbi:phage tail sheath family protein [Flavilitoribacter nigricans]|uniref:Phage tail protein n=1 Tax=Flavilitoribacter nigricans (strain ATCC 23147 / DSM 23189 / NBRC 102662 / NCIMB 1420 / SS-2) TaxID=1122177 RepID=A0A2D0NC48_FLAN2|nr:phage tail sheath C-terminal domain-containing protein [Flavilitoribacter nigricans]PHN06067.1 phage tail protein [Flavilitoribacter nigricans DSM 23189 = NBRC 102662]
MSNQPVQQPGVYIEEVNAFPNSVVQVATAVPAFIGYTPQAEYEGKSYLFKPVAINSMAEFMDYFAYPAEPVTKKAPAQYSPSYYLTKQKKAPEKGNFYHFNGDIYTIEPDPNTIYYLYNMIKLFFQNGGSQAYIVSVGTYGPASGAPIDPGSQIINPNVRLSDLIRGLDMLKKVPEVTMYIFPEATLLGLAENGSLMEQSLVQCGSMQTAVAIFDVIGGREPDPIGWTKDIENFRNSTGNNSLKYGVAYYPYLKTTAVPIDEVTYQNINGGDVSVLDPILNPPAAPNPNAKKILDSIAKGNEQTVSQNSAALAVASATYKQILSIIQEKINTLPPSGVMAGVYSLVDNTQGVWKAPANVTPIGVSDITIRLNDQDQQGLNVDAVSGKSVNAIRFFPGLGVLVWGARTLDGNSQDWRYVNVRRTATMIEQSIKLALRSFVFAPNTQNTWTSIQSMLENFLTNIWKEGALQGAQPGDAFSVRVGLGTTMTAQDILDGMIRVSVLLAVSHPAEFIVVTVEQELAKS